MRAEVLAAGMHLWPCDWPVASTSAEELFEAASLFQKLARCENQERPDAKERCKTHVTRGAACFQAAAMLRDFEAHGGVQGYKRYILEQGGDASAVPSTSRECVLQQRLEMHGF